MTDIENNSLIKVMERSLYSGQYWFTDNLYNMYKLYILFILNRRTKSRENLYSYIGTRNFLFVYRKQEFNCVFFSRCKQSHCLKFVLDRLFKFLYNVFARFFFSLVKKLFSSFCTSLSSQNLYKFKNSY